MKMKIKICSICWSLDTRRRDQLYDAAAHQDNTVLKFLLKSSQLDINIDRNRAGGTPLHGACSHSKSDNVISLLERGADPNARDDNGRSPLHLACATDNLFIVKQLISRGAIVDLRDHKGRTPLHKAFSSGHSHSRSVIEFLVRIGADPFAQDESLMSPAHLAFDVGANEWIKVFLDLGFDINKPCQKGVPIYVSLDKKPFSEGVERAQVFSQHIIKLEHLNKFISDENKGFRNILRMLIFEENYFLVARKVSEEIERLKQTSLLSSFSLFDFARANTDKLVIMLNNKALLEKLISIKFTENFPMFGRRMLFSFERAYAIRKLIDTAITTFEELFPILLPREITENILKRLTIQELKIFTDTSLDYIYSPIF